MGLFGFRARRNSIWRLVFVICVIYLVYKYWSTTADEDDTASAARNTASPSKVYSHRRPDVRPPPLNVRLGNADTDDDDKVLADQGRGGLEDGKDIPDAGQPMSSGSRDVHVVFAFGSEYIVPAYVAVNSTITNSKGQERLVLHLLVEEAITSRVHDAFLRAFGNMAEVYTEKLVARRPNENDWGEEREVEYLGRKTGGKGQTGGGGGTRPRIVIDPFDVTSVPNVKVWQGPQNLVHPLNYARFQLADIYPQLEKVIYVDPDVVVQADIVDMWDGHLQDRKYVIAAAPSKTEKYAKFIIDNSVAKVDLNEKYFNAGVLMINLRLWKRRNKDAEIARWLELNRERPVYKFGSQPPLLLAFYRDYEPMSELWNFRHLGHKLTLKLSDIDKAHLLHFNGPRKPWRTNGIEAYRPYWARHYHPDPETHALLVWGFEELQDKYRDTSHRACFTRPACQAEAERLALEPVWMHIDAEPNKPKFFPLLNNFLNDMWRMQNVKFIHNEEYPWRFLWIRKQSDLPTRLAKLQFDWSKVDATKHLVNFIPGVFQESYSKEALCRNTQQFALHHGHNSPALAGMLDCYILPEQAVELQKVAAQNPDKVWISKAFQESSGHGIELFAGKNQLPPITDTKARLVQSYVENPFLVHVLGGMRKTDLRLYAVVTSFDPLRVFLHPVGQVKVAQKAYTADYTDMFAHISNKVGSAEREYDTSNEELRKERQIDEFKYRLTLDDLADMMEPEKYRDAWERTEDLVVRAILAVSQNLGCKSAKYPHTCGTAYQLFGIDVVYDKDMNPHLMEINNDPGWNPYYERRRILMATQGGTATSPNNQCKFPFVHNDKKYFECAKPEGDKSEGPWCYTDDAQTWGYCNAKDESVHNQDALQRVFNVVYGDMLFLAGVLPYNREFETAVRERYSYLCGNAILPVPCRKPDVMEVVVKMANEMQSMGNYRMVFPQKGYRSKYMPLLAKYSGPSDRTGTIDQATLDIYDIFTEYFSYDFQDAALYRKKKSNR